MGEKLDQTEFAQPALFVCGLAAVEKLKKEDPGAAAKASCAAGLSLGEYTALVFAGVMSFEDALKVVKVRWEDTLRALIGAGKSSMYELGPNKQIRSMVKRVDGDVWKAFTNVEP